MKKIIIIIGIITTLAWACQKSINPYQASRSKKEQKASRELWLSNIKFELEELYRKINPTANKKHQEEIDEFLARSGKTFREEFHKEMDEIFIIKKDHPDTVINITGTSTDGFNTNDIVVKNPKYKKHDLSLILATDHQMEYYFQEVKILEKNNPLFLKWEPYREAANTGKNCVYLNPVEKEIIILHNYVRMNPLLFRDTYLREYILRRGIHWKENYYLKTLYDELSDMKSCSILYPDHGLCKAAKFHSLDMGNSGRIGHADSRGGSAANRVSSFTNKKFNGENCSYSFTLDPVHHIMLLLIG